MTVAGQISDERLAEVLKPFAALGQYLIDMGISKRDAAGLWAFDKHVLTYGDFRAAAAALTELQHRREAEAGKSNYPEIPEGWVLAPREPDDGMMEAGAGSFVFGTPGMALVCYRAMLAAAPKPPSFPASGVRVTPLRWELSLPNNVWIAKSIIGVYHIHIEGGRHQAWMESFVSGKIDQWDGPDRGDLYAAQADADAHYSAAILSALGEHP